MHFGRFASRKSEAKYPSLWDGLVGAWCPSVQNPSGNTLYDLSGRNNHGTLTNMDPANDWVRGNGYGAIDLDGTNDHISIPGFQQIFGPNIGLSAWFLNRGNYTSYSALIDAGTSPSTRQFSVFFGGSATNLYMAFRTFGGSEATISTTLQLNVWTHLFVSVQVGIGVRVFVNGRDVANLSPPGFIGSSYSNYEIQIGGNPSTAGARFNGLVDDFIFYNKSFQPADIRLLASQRGIAFTPKRRSIFRQLTNRLRSSRFAAFPA